MTSALKWSLSAIVDLTPEDAKLIQQTAQVAYEASPKHFEDLAAPTVEAAN